MTKNNNKVQLGDFLVDLQQEKLFSQAVEIKLEPKTFALLQLFIKSDANIVSRDEIMGSIWQGRQVSDDAIRAVVKKLRQALSDDARNPQYIKTLPLKGYRLIAELTPVIDVQSSSKINTQTSASSVHQAIQNSDCLLENKSVPTAKHSVAIPVNNKIKVTGFIALLIALVAIIAVFTFNKLTTDNLDIAPPPKKTLLTQMAGSEVSADYSPINNTLVFSHRSSKNEPLALYIKNLTTNRVQRLTWDEAQYANALWSTDGKKLLFSRSDNTGASLFITTINKDGEIEPKPLVSDKLKGKFPLAWSKKPNTFYVKSSSAPASPQRIYLYNILHDTLTNVTSPNVSGAGDYFAKESYDGEKLAILRAISAKKHELLILDIETQTLLVNHVLPFIATKLAWHPNHQKIVLSSFKGKVSTFDIAHQQLNDEVLKLPFANDIFYQCGDQCYFLRQHNGNFLDIQEHPIPFYQQQLMVNDHIELISADDLPTYNARGDAIYFVSLFEDKQVIHRQKENAALEPLYTLSVNDRISALSINPDETMLLGTINQRVFTYDIKAQAINYLTSDLIHARFPTWHQNGQDIYFSINENNTNNLYHYQQATQSTQLIANNILAGKPISKEALIVIDNKLIAHKVRLEDLLDTKHSNNILLNHAVGKIETAAPNRWHLKDNFLYFSQRVGQSSELVRINLENYHMEKEFLAKNRFRLNFALHPRQEKMLVVKSLLAQSNLIKAQL